MMIQITPWEHGRFWVSSETQRNRRYLVDILHHNGRGKCDCDNYRIRMEAKNLRARCKHIQRVLEWLGEQVVNEMLETSKLQNEPIP